MSTRRLVTACVAALLMVSVAAAAVIASRVSENLEGRAADAVQDLRGVEVDMDGRSLTLRAGDPATAAAALDAIASIDGIRSVTVVVGGGDPATDDSVPTPSSPPTTSTTPSPSTTSTTPPTTPSTTQTTAPGPPTTSPDTTGPDNDVQAAIDQLLRVAPIAFVSESSDQPTEDSKATLTAVAELLAAAPGTVSVVGTQERTSGGDVDLDLGLARAWAVAGYLEWRGIGFERLEVRAEAATSGGDPFDPTTTRVTITVNEGGG